MNKYMVSKYDNKQRENKKEAHGPKNHKSEKHNFDCFFWGGEYDIM